MKEAESYQPDTLRFTKPLKEMQQIPAPGALNPGRAPAVPVIPLTEREELRTSQDTVAQQPAPPTREQLRWWWWQREKNLLVDSSRYMEPRAAGQVYQSHGPEKGSFRLPVREVNRYHNDWLTLLILLAVVLLASVRTGWNKYLVQLFHAVVTETAAERLFQEKNNSVYWAAFQLDVLFYLMFSAFIFQLTDYFQVEIPGRNFVRYAICLAAVVSYFMVKKILYRLTGFLVEQGGETWGFLFRMNNFNRVTGIMLLPVVLLIAFSPFRQADVLITAGILSIISLYVLLIARGFITLLKKEFSIFYLFLYFCTLEFLPLVLIYNILVV
jgi:hypothetical protein